MKKSRFTDSQILAILKQAEAGTPLPTDSTLKCNARPQLLALQIPPRVA